MPLPTTRQNSGSEKRPHLTRTGKWLIAIALCCSGCESMGLGKWQKPKFEDDQGARSEDPWTTQAGAEGRAGRPIEKEADPLNIRRFLMSEKAMEIERNCGVE